MTTQAYEPEWNAIILRYDEIGLKGNNRSHFEKITENNIRYLLKQTGLVVKIHRVRGRIWLDKADKTPFNAEELKIIHDCLPRAFGVVSYSPVMLCGTEEEQVTPLAIEMTMNALRQASEFFKRPFSFRLRMRRANKKFPLISRDFELKIVNSLPKNQLDFSQISINLNDDADLTIGVEVRDEFAFVWYDTYPAAGGLPVGSNDDVLVLLSGGIDSPVAAWKMMKRGCHCHYVTFDSFPYTPAASVQKVKRLVNSLDRWQGNSVLWICNINDIQKKIRDLCTPKFRTILYRRVMMRVSCIIARRRRIQALVTGEAVGQVASQTIANMNVINDAASCVVIRPLSGADKSETIQLAERIGTFEISKEQVPDSCTVFAPDSPCTRAKMRHALEEEAKIPELMQMIEEVAFSAERWVAHDEIK